MKNLHNYNPKDGDLGTVESRFFECFHCKEKFNLFSKEKLAYHLAIKHFPDVEINCIRKLPTSVTMCNLIDGLYRCKNCNYIVGKQEKPNKLYRKHLNKCQKK